jgi:hypothetical protein
MRRGVDPERKTILLADGSKTGEMLPSQARELHRSWKRQVRVIP